MSINKPKKILIVLQLLFVFGAYLFLKVVEVKSATIVGHLAVPGANNTKFPSIDAFCSEIHVGATNGSGDVDSAMYWTKQDGAGNFGIPFRVGDADDQPDYATADVAVGQNGTLHYAWIKNSETDDIVIRSRNAGGAWGPERVVSGPNGTKRTNVKVATSGSTLIVVWRELSNGKAKVAYRYSTNNGESWSAAASVSNDFILTSASIAANSKGQVAVAYETESDPNSIKVAVFSGNGWSVETVSTGGFNVGPGVTITPSGIIYTAWRVGNAAVYVGQRNSANNWSTQRVASGDLSNFVDGLVSIASDVQGGLHVAWVNKSPSAVRYATRKAGATIWSEATPIVSTDLVNNPDIAASFSPARGILAHIVAEDFAGGLKTRYYLYSTQ